MTIRKLLLPLQTASTAEAAFSTAFMAARSWGAHLAVLHVIPGKNHEDVLLRNSFTKLVSENGLAVAEPKAGDNSRLVAIQDWHLLLDRHGTAHRSVDAVEHNEQRITPVWTILPPYSSIAGSITSLRSRRSRSGVPASSKPIRLL
jgi:hypothetical protein